jgi:ribonucleoside-diphosphate reductase alpha chain
MEQILKQGTLRKVAAIPDSIKEVYVTSLDIKAEDHIRMQAAVQRYCCNAISKTINFQKDATEEEVRVGYIEGWKAGCKGLTVYRNESRSCQVLETSADIVKTTVDACFDGKCDI